MVSASLGALSLGFCGTLLRRLGGGGTGRASLGVGVSEAGPPFSDSLAARNGYEPPADAKPLP